ncbi:MAG: hypothetical protein U0271_08310 [Polyangiaceae bacterium]
MRAAARAIALVCLAVAIAGGCRQLLELDDRREPPGGACGAVPLAPGACEDCSRTACCAEVSACGASESCAAFFACSERCASGDDACRDGCRRDAPDALDLVAVDLQECQASACSCERACGGYVFPAPACGACARTHCCAEATACVRSADCMGLGVCERACVSAADYYACLGDCRRAWPDGAELGRTLGACVDENCLEACGDPRWACLGASSWPPPAHHPVRVGLSLRRFASVNDAPLPGLRVRFCAINDFDCRDAAGEPDPLSEGFTDENGRFSVEVQPSASGVQGYFEVTKDPGSRAPDIYPALVFVVGPPLTSEVEIVRRLPSIEELAALPSTVWVDDPALGSVFANPYQCASASVAPGVHLEVAGAGVTDATVPFYLRNGLPVVDVSETDAAAGGGFFNLRESPVTVSATVVATGQHVGEVVGFVRGGALSYFSIYPTPQGD